MQDFESAPPPADALSESLRGFGYSIETAIADIIDNSITAQAKNVWITVQLGGSQPFVRILDDGIGMDEDTLRAAMRLGSQSPLVERSAYDLGRFGLGLKTASFSQARSLTVASKFRGETHVRRWDLDYLAASDGEWRLLTNPPDGSDLHLQALDDLEHGSVVFWEKLDRLRARQQSDGRSQSSHLLMEQIEHHLAMVFQRYLDGPNPRLRLYVNDARVAGWDPFLSNHPACQKTPEETIGTGGSAIRVKGFVLPNKDMLSAEEYEAAGGVEGWVTHEGFYVYRNDRLLVAGGWLGLGINRPWVRDETHKLARIRLDLPNSVDESWQIDVKKSDASPPENMRNRLRDLAHHVRTMARSVFVHRGEYGRRPPVPNLQRPWRSTTVAGNVAYRVDRAHLIADYILHHLDDEDRSIENFFRLLEQTVPVEKIWIDTVERGELPASPLSGETREEIRKFARDLFNSLGKASGADGSSVREQLKRMAPFDQFPEIIDEI